jgi:molybdenum cofactor biosynthesis enzyme MoaA
MRKARVLVTKECNRDCDGCCNKSDNLMGTMQSIDFNGLISQQFDEIIITGGEPLLLADKLLKFLKEINFKIHFKHIYLYSALFVPKYYKSLLNLELIGGLHFTVHYEATDKDIVDLKGLSEMLKEIDTSHMSKRLVIGQLPLPIGRGL